MMKVFSWQCSSFPCTAPADYIAINEAITFMEIGVQCINITIAMDGTVEGAESFSVVLVSQDYRVEEKMYSVPVTILDSDG